MYSCVSQLESIDVSAKQEWVVESDPVRPKAESEYDAIIVGGGFGGLTSGALLAKSGYKVLLLEQQSQVGGYCTSYVRKGFTFPVGAHDISGCDQGGIGKLLSLLSLKKEDFFALHTRTYMFGDKKITFTGTNNDLVNQLSELFPKEKDHIAAFFAEARKALSEEHAPSSPTQTTFAAWKQATYQQKLDEFFQNQELKKFLCSLIGYIGTKPEETVASDALDTCFSYFLYGGYYPKQGGKLFADALKRVIESHGGTVLLNTHVDEILEFQGHVVGVRARENTFLSTIVIANANAKTLFLNLVPQKALDPAFLDAIRNLKMSMSLAIVNLGVDMDLSVLSSIMKGQTGFFISSNADPAAAPKGCASLSKGMHAQYAEVPPIDTPEYKEYKEKLAVQALSSLETVIPGIRDHIIVKDVITPRTLERFTSMPEGALYSFDQSRGTKRPYFKTPIQGLYLASSSTLPGGGVEAVVFSGMICARDIIDHKKNITK
jgi:all-trans-retinol 13,14-reductase